MNRQPGFASGSRVAYFIGSGLLALLFLYVASIGPATYALARHREVGRVFGRVYAPLLALPDSPFGRPIKTYAFWWINLGEDPFAWNKTSGRRSFERKAKVSAEPPLELELQPVE